MREEKLKTNQPLNKDNQSKRLGILLLFLGTILLSLLFWLKNKLGGWWSKITGPSVYKIERE